MAPSNRRRDAAGRTHILVFLAPAALIYTLFSIYPLLDTIRFALYSQDETGVAHFVGLSNFIDLLTHPVWADQFRNALVQQSDLLRHPCDGAEHHRHRARRACSSLPRLFGRNIYRTLIFLPTMLSVVIIGFIWQLILSPLWGVSEGFLRTIGLPQLFAPWLGQESSALITVSLISVWQFVGIPMMLIYAALLNIPEDLVDAATVDGANHLHVFFYVKLPLILPTIGLVAILTFVANFNAFDLIYAVKGALAGPNFSTDIMGTFFYRTFFGYQLQVGNPTMGAAVATMMFVIILIGVMLYLFGVQRRMQRYAL